MSKATVSSIQATGAEGARVFFAGLGNPGKEYENTYHNVGRLALAALMKAFEARRGRTPGARRVSRTQLAGAACTKDGDLVWIEPKTFMNESGAAVREALAFFDGSPSELVVLHDDADLPLGSHKITTGQRDAGHRGVRSVIRELGTRTFARVRIGVGREPREKAEEYVLSKIARADLTKLTQTFAEIANYFMGEREGGAR
ncbi:MAG: aminoacyl-tRNA hydrolase [Candidatus Colwellbacteria bacterium]|nr:aminoacyl-tRNA hydrolase [Candidatus Colwellbacteria bacterium]